MYEINEHAYETNFCKTTKNCSLILIGHWWSSWIYVQQRYDNDDKEINKVNKKEKGNSHHYLLMTPVYILRFYISDIRMVIKQYIRNKHAGWKPYENWKNPEYL